LKIRIKHSEYEKLRDHAREGYPHEVVGLLGGSRKDGVVHHVERLVNERTDSPGTRYRVDGLAVFDGERRIRARGLDTLGYYHSHPDHPAVYSEEDRRNAHLSMSYLILSVLNGEVEDVQSWRLLKDRSAMQAETVEVED
jgi:proteasome lid subunit RPN8/RPN11